MNNFNTFFKNLMNWIEHIISVLGGIAGILGFYGINYNKMKPFILLAINKFKNRVYRPFF